MMLMFAMGIMVMMAAVIVRGMIVRMTGVMRGMMMVMVLIVAMIIHRMAMTAIGIGATLRIEWRLDFDDAGAEALHHGLDHMVAPDPQALRHDLRRQMPIAEMPGEANQMQRVDAADFDQGLGCGDHFDHAAVLEQQGIAAAQRDRVFEIEQEFEPARTHHRHPPPVPVVEIEHDGIGGWFFPAMLRTDFCGADHRLRASGLWRH